MTTYDTKKHKQVKVGEIIGDEFVKRVIDKKHFFKLYKGYGIQKSVLQELVSKGVRKVKIINDKGMEYVAPISVWVQYGVVKDFGHGEQVFLSIDRMTSDKQLGLL